MWQAQKDSPPPSSWCHLLPTLITSLPLPCETPLSFPIPPPIHNLQPLIGATSPPYKSYAPYYLFWRNPPSPSPIPMWLVFPCLPVHHGRLPTYSPTSHQCWPFHFKASTSSFIVHMFCVLFHTVPTTFRCFSTCALLEPFTTIILLLYLLNQK